MAEFQPASILGTADDPRSQWLTEALLELAECEIFRKLKSLDQPGFNTIGANVQQNHYQDPYGEIEETNATWAQRMRENLEHMDQENNGFVHTFRFLDIGCCPGGYMAYILLKCPQATGMGISLPFEDGGPALAIPQDLFHRIELRTADLTLFDLAPSRPKPLPPQPTGLHAVEVVPIPFPLNSFDFVICDAHHLDVDVYPDNIRPWNRTRLLISEILLALRAIYPGGKIFLRLSCVEHPLTARILIIFSRIADYVCTIKSKLIHKKLETFYLLAEGIRIDTSEYRKLVDGLEKLWYVMTFGGQGGFGREITWVEQELIIPWEEVVSPNGVKQIARLGEEVWRIQYKALQKFLHAQSQGIEIDID